MPLMVLLLADKSHYVLNKREGANVGPDGRGESGWNGRLRARYARRADDDVLGEASICNCPIKSIWCGFRGTTDRRWVETDLGWLG